MPIRPRKSRAATTTSILGEVLDAWSYTREGVVAEVKNLPESAFEFRPHDHARTAREIVQHIIESGLMMSGELSRPDGDFLRKPYRALLREHGRGLSGHRTKAALIAALARTHADGVKRVAAFGEVAMLQTIRQFNGQPAMRITWMHYGIAHEEYHRGQLALYARLVGRVPALTQLIHGG